MYYKDITFSHTYKLDEENTLDTPTPSIGFIGLGRMGSAMANGMKDLDWCATYEVTRMEAGMDNIKEK